jgi:hypothetical protein
MRWAGVTYVEVEDWQAELDGLLEVVGARFGRSEPRERLGRYVGGLVAGLERKNGWTIAEQAGEVSPDGMQRLLRRTGASTAVTVWSTPARTAASTSAAAGPKVTRRSRCEIAPLSIMKRT